MKNSMQYVGFGTRQLSSGIHVMTGCFETRIGENACRALDHAATRAAVTAERAVLSALGGRP